MASRSEALSSWVSRRSVKVTRRVSACLAPRIPRDYGRLPQRGDDQDDRDDAGQQAGGRPGRGKDRHDKRRRAQERQPHPGMPTQGRRDERADQGDDP